MDDHIGEETQSVMTDQQQYIVVLFPDKSVGFGSFSDLAHGPLNFACGG